jgi:hypothetical protein
VSGLGFEILGRVACKLSSVWISFVVLAALVGVINCWIVRTPGIFLGIKIDNFGVFLEPL